MGRTCSFSRYDTDIFRVGQKLLDRNIIFNNYVIFQLIEVCIKSIKIKLNKKKTFKMTSLNTLQKQSDKFFFLMYGHFFPNIKF